MTIGQRINYYRKKLNLSQEALGEKLNVSRQAVYKWEADISLPDTTNLIELSKIFNITLSEMIGEEVADDKQAPEQVSIDKPTIVNESNRSKIIVIAILCVVVVLQLLNNVSQSIKISELGRLISIISSTSGTYYPSGNLSNSDKFNSITYELESIDYEKFEMSYRVIFSLKEQPVEATVSVFIDKVVVDVERDSNNVYNTLVTVAIGENQSAGIIINDGKTIETIAENHELTGIETRLVYLMPTSSKSEGDSINMKFEWRQNMIQHGNDYELNADALVIGPHTYDNITLIAIDDGGEETRIKLPNDIYDYEPSAIIKDFTKGSVYYSYQLSIEIVADNAVTITYPVGSIRKKPLQIIRTNLQYETEILIEKLK